MAVEHLEILVEEASAEEVLRTVLPKILDETSFAVYSYQGKSDLLAKLPARLRGYASWLPPGHVIVVLIDRDSDDCHELKRQLEAAAAAVGLPTRARRDANGQFKVINRIAIEELEAWLFGDWTAVQAAYPGVPITIPRKPKYRDPDAIAGGTWEALERIMKRAGYFTTGLRKIEVARAISPHMDPTRNRSRSFQVLRDSLAEMVRGGV